ncbi:MAG: hypothetical protein ABIK09_02785 [Pseudomonadota bacterium]
MVQQQRAGWVGIIAVILVVGCTGGGGGTHGTEDVAQGETTTPDVTISADLEDLEPGGHCGAELILELFNGASPLVLEVDREYVLQARIYDPVTGDTPEGEVVTFALTGDGDGQILQAAAETDGFGVAAVDLSTGAQAPVLYDLRIDTPCAPGIDVVLDVRAHATGTILLTLTVGGDVTDPEKIDHFGVYVSQSGLLCAAAEPVSPSPDMALYTLGAEENQLLIEDAVAGPGTTIMVVGYDDGDSPVGAGCTEGISVFAGKETVAAVTLGPLQISPTGSYELTMAPDFGVLTTGHAPGWSAALEAGLDTVPGDVKTTVLDGILVWMDDGVLPEQCDDVSVEINESVDVWAAAHLPPAWAVGLEDVAAPLQDLLTDPIFGASLAIEGGAFGGACVATLDIKSLELGDALFLEDAFETGEAWLKAGDSDIVCEVTSANELLLHEFELHVNPGRLLLFAFVNVVLPDVADGATSMVELFTGHFDCAAMLAGVKQSTLTCINRPMSELVEDCDDAVYAALGDYLALAAIVGAEQALVVSGAAALSDDDKDLEADALMGAFTGTWILGGADNGAVTVPFTGLKL